MFSVAQNYSVWSSCYSAAASFAIIKANITGFKPGDLDESDSNCRPPSTPFISQQPSSLKTILATFERASPAANSASKIGCLKLVTVEPH
jgi:hypothetical protein